MAAIPYFLAMKQSNALQEQIRDDRYLQADEAVSHFVTKTHAKVFFPIMQQTMQLKGT